MPETDNVFILPGASPDAWAPRLLGRIDPWSADNPASGGSTRTNTTANRRVVLYPRTAGPGFGPNVPYADESIAIGVDLTTEEIHKAEGPMLVACLSLGSITADAVQRAIDADPERPDPDQLTFIVSGDASRITPVSTGIGAFLPEGFRIPLLGWTVTRPEDDRNTTPSSWSASMTSPPTSPIDRGTSSPSRTPSSALPTATV